MIVIVHSNKERKKPISRTSSLEQPYSSLVMRFMILLSDCAYAYVPWFLRSEGHWETKNPERVGMGDRERRDVRGG